MIYYIKNEFLSVGVEDEGAQLYSIKSIKSGVEYLWQGDSKYWNGRAYNLFPIVGRLYKNTYTVNGKEYNLDPHGFARRMRYTLVEKSDNSMTFAISSNSDTIEKYPFEFVFKVKFSIEKNALTVTYLVTNVGEGDMYFGLGGHPGFNVPFDGGKFEDYYIEFDKECSPKRLLVSESYLMSGESENYPLENGVKMKLRHDMFDGDAVILQDHYKSLKIKRDGSNRAIGVSFPKMTYLGIWHAVKTDAPYVCIEPWENLASIDGAVEALEQKAHIGILGEGQTYQSPMIITIEE